MATIDLNFNKALNSSLQIGDIAFYLTPSTDGNYQVQQDITQVKRLGAVRKISETGGVFTVKVDISDNTASPTTSDFILFAKNNRANISGISGYYGEITFTNNKTSAAELYSINSEVFESSK